MSERKLLSTVFLWFLPATRSKFRGSALSTIVYSDFCCQELLSPHVSNSFNLKIHIFGNVKLKKTGF